MTRRTWKLGLAILLVLVLTGGTVSVFRDWRTTHHTRITAYFTDSIGLFPGDEVRILGVRVGKIDTIEAQPKQVKITFLVDSRYKVPAQAKAVILSPSLVSARAIQLVPAYVNGPVMESNAVIPLQRTAVPVEWDDLRNQLQKLVEALQPTKPGGVSTLGAFVDTAADNLRGQGTNIHDTIIKLSQAFSALGDHSDDVFSTVKNLSVVVSALRDSRDLMRQLNENLAATTAVLSNDRDEVGQALVDVNNAVGDVQTFASENRESLGTTSDKLASISTALHESLDDVKQALHIAPGLVSNFANIYPPAVAGFTGALTLNEFANPIQFLCGAIEAASRLNAAQSAKLCVQYLAPILKNRQYNFAPLGENLFVGAYARPNEITYSEDWLRPDYVPPPAPPESGPQRPPNDQASNGRSAAEEPADMPVALPAEVPPRTPVNSLHDMLVPAGAGS